MDVTNVERSGFKSYPVNTWVKWEGGDKAPIKDGVKFNLKFRDKVESDEHTKASDWTWKHRDSNSDIVEFKVYHEPLNLCIRVKNGCVYSVSGDAMPEGLELSIHVCDMDSLEEPEQDCCSKPEQVYYY